MLITNKIGLPFYMENSLIKYQYFNTYSLNFLAFNWRTNITVPAVICCKRILNKDYQWRVIYYTSVSVEVRTLWLNDLLNGQKNEHKPTQRNFQVFNRNTNSRDKWVFLPWSPRESPCNYDVLHFFVFLLKTKQTKRKINTLKTDILQS